MTTSNLYVNPLDYGLPTETELTAAANELFSELDGSIYGDNAESLSQNFYYPDTSTTGLFEPEVCAQGIEKLVTQGDTSVINRAVEKLQSLETDYDALSGLASEFEAFSDLGGGYTDLQNYISGENSKQSADRSAGYSPNVLSFQQAEEISSIEARTTATDNNVIPAKDYKGSAVSGTVGGQQNNREIVVGTKTLEQIREDFPILQEKVNGNPLIWLDNGATTQRPKQVIDRLSYYYEHENSNVHRGAHTMAARSTDAYEGARQTVADFIGAPSKDNVVFVRGTTEGINLVAQAYVKQYLEPGDEIIVSLLEHHANIVPWQLVAQETGAVIKVIPVDASGQIILSEYEKLFSKRTKFVSVTHVSNVLGTITPVAELVAIAHRYGVRILIDGAQSIAHIPINVSALDADFYVFSGHKVYAPTGIGALYGKKEVLEAAKPYHGGGNMIADVTFERTIYNPAPNKFEAGTGSIGDAVALGTALDYLKGIGMPEISRYEHELVQYGMKELGKIPGLHLIGTAREKSSALSFVLDGSTIDSVGQQLDQHGIAVRVGHHCAQPILRSYGLEGVVRPTLALYNTPEDIDILVKAIRSIR